MSLLKKAAEAIDLIAPTHRLPGKPAQCDQSKFSASSSPNLDPSQGRLHGLAVRHPRRRRRQLPSDWSVASILQLVLDVLGITLEKIYGKIRVRAVAMIGERNVAFIEKVVSLLVTLVKQGPGAALEQAAVDVLGERNVQIIKTVGSMVHTLFTAGPQALWEQAKEYLSNLKDELLKAVQEWVVTASSRPR